MAYIGRTTDGFGVRSRFIYTATGGQTTFNTDDSGNALSYSDGAYVDVYLNGVLLDPADYTDTSLTSIVLGSGATASDILEVIVYDVFSVFSGTFTTGITAGDAIITGDLTVDTDTLFVDASADKVAMGTTSADADASVLSIKGTDPAQIYDGQIIIHGSATSGAADTGAGIGFKGHHGTGNRNLGAIQSLKENATSGNADAYMRFVTRSNSGGLAEAMRIDSSGNVGIGTTSPAHLIDCRTTGETEQVVANFSSTGDGSDRQRLEIYVDPSTQTTELYGGAGGGSENNTNLAFSTRQGGSGRVEAMRIDSSGNVGIGTTSPQQLLEVENTGGVAQINITADQSSQSILALGDENNQYVQHIVSDHSDNSMRFHTAAALGTNERMRILSGGGITFNGDTAAANALDDYEEGTFTPTYIGSSSNPTVTYDKQNGHYVKIGRQVIANIEIRTDAFSGGSGNMYVSGLPFTPVAPTGTTRAGTGHIGYQSAFNDKSPQTAYINGGTNAIILLKSADTDSWGENDTAMASSDFLDGSNKNFLMITAIYTA